MRIDADVAIELASHEGLVRQAYKDSVGVWTWCIGITSASGHNVNRYIGNPQSLEHCMKIYVWALEKYADDVRRVFAAKPLNKHQFAAALSFHYNTGAIARAAWVKKWLAGDVAGAKKSFMDWRKPAEIIPRRQKERDLFFDGKWSNNGAVTEYTRLQASGAPNWSSATRTNIRPAMEAVFGAKAAPPAAPKPAPAPKPIQKPDAAPAPLPGADDRNRFLAFLIDIFAALFGKRKDR